MWIQVNKGHTSTDGVLRDYCDGTEYNNHPLLSLDPHFLQLFLYYDDLEVCNPIGSKRIIHKLGTVITWSWSLIIHIHMYYSLHTAVFYFVIGNVAPMFRSKVRRIQLAAIAKSEHVKKYGMNAILEPIVADIKKLVCVRTSCFMVLSRKIVGV